MDGACVRVGILVADTTQPPGEVGRRHYPVRPFGEVQGVRRIYGVELTSRGSGPASDGRIRNSRVPFSSEPFIVCRNNTCERIITVLVIR